MLKVFGFFLSVASLVKLFCMTSTFPPTCAVTYSFTDGRFGDHILSYMHAKWVSYKHEVPLVYRSFPGSEELVLDQKEPYYYYSDLSGIQCMRRDDGKLLEFEKRRVLRRDRGLVQKGGTTLYDVPYFPECPQEQQAGDLLTGKKWPNIPVTWDDKGFKAELRRLIVPKKAVTPIPLPEGRKSVAVHVRRPSGADTADVDRSLPYKLPPLSFYVEQLRSLHDRLNAPLYAFIFTDDRRPEEITRLIREGIEGLDIVVEGRKAQVGLLEDFFNIPRFDCLIRGMSNFSIAASKIASFEIEIEPSAIDEVNGEFVVTAVNTIGDKR